MSRRVPLLALFACGGVISALALAQPQPSSGAPGPTVPAAAAPAQPRDSSVPNDDAALIWIKSAPAGVEFTKSEVTVAQYRGCVNARVCSAPQSKDVDKQCNWGHATRDDYPVNCVNWYQAMDFCLSFGARLPTVEEWTSEATANDTRYFPWGIEKPSCDLAVMREKDNVNGCGKSSTWPVCSRPSGNSVSGLCDMAGNLWEWAHKQPRKSTDVWLFCGGSWTERLPDDIRDSLHGVDSPHAWRDNVGFRCARQSRD